MGFVFSAFTLSYALFEVPSGYFADRYGIDEAKLARAVRAGLLRAIDDAEEAGALSPLILGPLRGTIEDIPLDDLRATFEAVMATPFRLAQQELDSSRTLDATTYTLGELIQHALNHSTYHRGQVALLLRQLGHTPPFTDYHDFLAEVR